MDIIKGNFIMYKFFGENIVLVQWIAILLALVAAGIFLSWNKKNKDGREK